MNIKRDYYEDVQLFKSGTVVFWFLVLTEAVKINDLIKTEIDAVNGTFSRVEQLKKFSILPKKRYVEDGEVTPTMKVKRSSVNEVFEDLITAMY